MFTDHRVSSKDAHGSCDITVGVESPAVNSQTENFSAISIASTRLDKPDLILRSRDACRVYKDRTMVNVLFIIVLINVKLQFLHILQ